MNNTTISRLPLTTDSRPHRTRSESDEAKSVAVQVLEFLLFLIWWPVSFLVSLIGLVGAFVAMPLLVILFTLFISLLLEGALDVSRLLGF